MFSGFNINGENMNHKVTVMPNKDSIYLPASLKLRSKKIEFIREVELSSNKIILSLRPDVNRKTGLIKLHFDKNNVLRQHALAKQKRLAEFMEVVNVSNKWLATIQGDLLILTPKVVKNG